MSPSPAFSRDRVIRRSQRQTSCDLGDERVLLNVASGVYYGLDPIGSRVWELLEVPRSVGHLTESLQAEYAVDAATCESDLVALLERLLVEGLIEVEAPA